MHGREWLPDQCSEVLIGIDPVLAPKGLEFTQNPETKLHPRLVWFIFSTVSSAQSALYKSRVFNPTVSSLYGYLPTLLGSVDE